MFCKYHNISKDKNLFQSFFEYVYIFSYCDVPYFMQILVNITWYEIEKCNFFGIQFMIIYKNIMKILFNNDMVEVQTWVPLKKLLCDNIFSPFSALSPLSTCYFILNLVKMYNITMPLKLMKLFIMFLNSIV